MLWGEEMTLNVLSDVRDGVCILHLSENVGVGLSARVCASLSRQIQAPGFIFGGGGGCTRDAALPWHQETAIIMCVYM